MTHTHGLYQAGLLNLERGTNRLDSGTPFYDSYETAEGKFMAIGAIESHFFQTLLALLGLDPEEIGEQMDRSGWPAMREKFEATFRSKTQAEWCRLLENTDACASPVLSVAEVGDHPHHQARRTFTEVDGVPQPAPAPRFSRTQGTIRRPPPEPGEHSREALTAWGFASDEVDRLLEAGVIAERASTDRPDR
jgi:alpha-methylacyl-CoA racemase